MDTKVIANFAMVNPEFFRVESVVDSVNVITAMPMKRNQTGEREKEKKQSSASEGLRNGAQSSSTVIVFLYHVSNENLIFLCSMIKVDYL